MAIRTAEFLWIAVPKTLGGALMLGLNILLLYHLDPASFGAYALCVSTILLIDAVIGSAFDMAVLRFAPQYRETDIAHAAAVEKAAFLLKISAVVVAGAVLAINVESAASFLLHDARRANLLLISVLAALGMLILRSGLVFLQVRGEFTAYGRLELIHSGLKYGGVALLIVLFPVSPAAVLLLFAIAPIVAFLTILKRYWPAVIRAPVAGTGATRELLVFVKWLLLTFGVAAIVGRMDVYFLSALTNLNELGIFAGGQIYAMVPELLGSYLAIVLSPRIMPLYNNGLFYPFFRRTQIMLVLFALLLLVMAVSLVTLVAPMLLPEAYTQSASIFLILLPGALATLITLPLTLPFLMFKRPRFLLILDLFSAPLLVLLFFLAIREHGAIGAAWVTTLSRLAKAGLAQLVAWRLASAEKDAPLPTMENARPG